MSQIYTRVEVIDIAKQLEDCGHAFYDEASRQVSDPEVAGVLMRLREEEKRHSTQFEALLGRLGAGEDAWRQDEGYLDYMRSLADGRVFPDVESARQSVRGLGALGVYYLALRFEQESVKFMDGMRRVLADSEHGLVDALVAEEQEHVRRIQQAIEARRTRKRA